MARIIGLDLSQGFVAVVRGTVDDEGVLIEEITVRRGAREDLSEEEEEALSCFDAADHVAGQALDAVFDFNLRRSRGRS